MQHISALPIGQRTLPRSQRTGVGIVPDESQYAEVFVNHFGQRNVHSTGRIGGAKGNAFGGVRRAAAADAHSVDAREIDTIAVCDFLHLFAEHSAGTIKILFRCGYRIGFCQGAVCLDSVLSEAQGIWYRRRRGRANGLSMILPPEFVLMINSDPWTSVNLRPHAYEDRRSVYIAGIIIRFRSVELRVRLRSGRQESGQF